MLLGEGIIDIGFIFGVFRGELVVEFWLWEWEYEIDMCGKMLL